MDATLTRQGTSYTLAFERQLSHPPEKVWRVLTERDLLKQWFPCDIEGEWKPGANLKFHFMHGEGDGLSEEELRGEVLVVDPPRRLEFRWGNHYYLSELTPDGDGCTLSFSDRFADGSEGARNAAGWELCLDNLDLLLDGAELAKFAMERWQERFYYYARLFEESAGAQKGLPDSFPEG